MIDMLSQLTTQRIATTQVNTHKEHSKTPKYIKTLGLLAGASLAGSGTGYLTCKYYTYPQLVKKFKNKRAILRKEFIPPLENFEDSPFIHSIFKDLLNSRIRDALSSAKEMLYFAKHDYPIKGAIIGLGVGLIAVIVKKIKDNKNKKLQ